ncbi:unnamed protein product [Moneuplotes crassus]|uniref:Uncharacterized protein n=1 Tax=Euplotes crassus TaxID=5936 RepID=A0AAD2D2J2_EUPCR|nr:unnamed protein product [Moneuplotes crassus]
MNINRHFKRKYHNTETRQKIRMAKIKVPNHRINQFTDQSMLNICIQRKPQEKLPVMRNKSHAKLQTHHIRDLISPAPVVTKERSKTRNLIKHTFTNKKGRKRRNTLLKRRGIKSQIRINKPKSRCKFHPKKPSLKSPTSILDVIVRGSNSPNTSAKSSSKERNDSDQRKSSSKNRKKVSSLKKQKKNIKTIQEKYFQMGSQKETSPRKSPEKDSTSSFENLGKGLVVIVSKEDSIPKNSRIHSNSRKKESKHAHSKTNSKDMSSKVLTRDEDTSEVQRNLSVLRKTRKNSASFTAVFGSENLSNNSVSPVSGSDKKEVFRKYSNDAFASNATKLSPTNSKSGHNPKRESPVGLSSENSSEEQSSRRVIFKNRMNGTQNRDLRLGDKEKFQRRKILRKPNSFSQVEYLETTNKLDPKRNESHDSVHSSEENTVMMPKLSQKSGLLSTFENKNSESQKLSAPKTTKERFVEWHERLYNKEYKKTNSKSPNKNESLNIISEDSSIQRRYMSPQNSMKQKLSFNSFLKVEPQIAYKAPPRNHESFNNMKSFMQLQKSNALFQEIKEENRCNSGHNEDFTSAVDKELVIRGWNKLNSSKLSVIDSSISKEVPNDEERYLVVSKHKRISFIESEGKEGNNKKLKSRNKEKVDKKLKTNLSKNVQWAQKEPFNIFCQNTPNPQKSLKPKLRKRRRRNSRQRLRVNLSRTDLTQVGKGLPHFH